MQKINPNDPAFPFVEPDTTCNVNTGMSIRTQLAATAMKGLLASKQPDSGYNPSFVAEQALEYADALINELNKEK